MANLTSTNKSGVFKLGIQEAKRQQKQQQKHSTSYHLSNTIEMQTKDEKSWKEDWIERVRKRDFWVSCREDYPGDSR